MNCRPGDLAVIVRTTDTAFGKRRDISVACIGRIVKVTRLRRPVDRSCEAALVWEFEEWVRIDLNGEVFYASGCADAVLRPLRDAPGEDESLRIAGRPNETIADLIAAEAGT